MDHNEPSIGKGKRSLDQLIVEVCTNLSFVANLTNLAYSSGENPVDAC
jgi:hypothetical protein